jgi:hypothetical protein
MDLKKIKYSGAFIILSLLCPMLAYSENTNTNTFKLAVNKKAKSVKKTQKAPALSGSWQSPDGNFTLVFLPGNMLEFNGEKEAYTLVPGAIQTVEDGEKIDYKYSLNGNTLVINFAEEGYSIQFQRVGGQTNQQYAQNNVTQNNKPAKKNTNCNNLQVLPPQDGNGCHIRLVTPAPCEEIDLSNGRSYEFAWQTGGSFCEAPFKFYIAGNPYSDQNVLEWKFSTKVGQVSRTVGGITNVTAQDLAGLSSVDGLYSWVVFSFYDSHPASQYFRVKF